MHGREREREREERERGVAVRRVSTDAGAQTRFRIGVAF